MLNAMAILDRRRAELPASARRAVELLGTDLRRFRRMVDDLLEISRDHSRDHLTLEPVNLTELAEQAAGEHGRQPGSMSSTLPRIRGFSPTGAGWNA